MFVMTSHTIRTNPSPSIFIFLQGLQEKVTHLIRRNLTINIFILLPLIIFSIGFYNIFQCFLIPIIAGVPIISHLFSLISVQIHHCCLLFQTHVMREFTFLSLLTQSYFDIFYTLFKVFTKDLLWVQFLLFFFLWHSLLNIPVERSNKFLLILLLLLQFLPFELLLLKFIQRHAAKFNLLCHSFAETKFICLILLHCLALILILQSECSVLYNLLLYFFFCFL